VPVTPTPPRRRSLWKRFRRATRGPRNAALAQGIWNVGVAVRALPLPVALALGRALGRAAHALLGTPRRLALRHVAMALPEADAGRLVRETFVHAGMGFVELAYWPKLRHRPDYVQVEGEEHMRRALDAGHGLVAITGHCGNWELLAATMSARGWPVSVVARKVNDQRFDALIRRFRGAGGMEILDRDDPKFLALVREALGRNRIVAILMDQDSRGGGVFVPFFGRLAHTPPGPAIIALRTKAPVIGIFIRRRPEGGHLVSMAPIPPETEGSAAGRIEATTARFTRAIEEAIRKAPAEWVWWHERWRRRPEGEG